MARGRSRSGRTPCARSRGDNVRIMIVIRFRLLLAAVILFAVPAALCGAGYSVRTLTLPGGTPGGIGMDYIAFDASTNSVWVPAGNTGAVDVIDARSGQIRQITGFPTKEVTVRDR